MSETSWKALLYERYTSGHVMSGVDELHSQLSARMPYLKRLIERRLPPERSARILDLGCGFGALLVALRNAGYRNTFGVDVSPEQVAAARSLGDFNVTCGDLLEYLHRQPTDSFDVVVLFDVIEHFTREGLLGLMSEVRRVMRSKGRVIVHVPNGEAIAPGVVRYGDLTHELAFTPASLRQLAHACGMNAAEIIEDRPIAHGPVSMVRAFLWWCMTLPLRVLRMVETGCGYRDPILSQNLLAILVKE